MQTTDEKLPKDKKMSNNFFCFKQFTIHQERCAMKVGTDGTLLGAWADMPVTREHPSILDIGTGTGLIALMMAQRFPLATIRAIDIDGDAVIQAAENIINSSFANRISVEQINVNDINNGIYDAIVCNPPYFTDSLHCPDKKRTIARHADTLTCDVLMRTAITRLAPDGEISVIIPSDGASDMLTAAAFVGLFVKRICHVKTTERKPAKRCLMAFTKKYLKTQPNETTIIIGDDEYTHMMKDFYI